MRTLLAICLTAACLAGHDHIDTRLSVADIHGRMQQPFAPAEGKLSALFFITADCPISNYYAAEIRRICTRQAGRLTCYLIYTDPTLSVDAIEKHKAEYGHGDYAAIFDQKQLLVKAAGATVTPEAALVNAAGELIYRGRIDDSYASWGKRRVVFTDHNLTDAIDATLSGKPIAQPRTKATGCFITPVEMLKNIRPDLQ